MLTDAQIDTLHANHLVEIFGKIYKVSAERFLHRDRGDNRELFVDAGLISSRNPYSVESETTLDHFYRFSGVTYGTGSFPVVNDLGELKTLLKCLAVYHRRLHMQLQRGFTYYFQGHRVRVAVTSFHLNVHGKDNWSVFSPFVENKELWARRWISEFHKQQQFPVADSMETLTKMWNDLRQKAGYKVFSTGVHTQQQTGPAFPVTDTVNRRAITITAPIIR